MEFNLHIERVVVDGVDIGSGQSDLIQASVTNELTQLINSGGIASNLVGGPSLNRVDTNNIHLSGEKPQALGQKIAQSVYGGIGRE